MLELYQHEDCPACSAVRRKLTEMGLDWVSRTVDPSPDRRGRVVDLTGEPHVPVLVDPDHRMIVTEADDICAYLEECFGPGRGPA
jgi:glutathione S-transferase